MLATLTKATPYIRLEESLSQNQVAVPVVSYELSARSQKLQQSEAHRPCE